MTKPARPKDSYEWRFTIKSLDWFLPAFSEQSGVTRSFKSVSQGLLAKLALIEAIQKNLTAQRGRSADSITHLHHKINELQTTLNFRLELLSPDRPGAFFREKGPDVGPFPGKILKEPIIAPYKAKKLEEIIQLLSLSFKKRTILNIPFTTNKPCLWFFLLHLNQCWEEINRLPAPYNHLRLQELPQKIPKELATPSLITFLTNVNQSLTSARNKLDQCYNQLQEACDRLWSLQISSFCAPDKEPESDNKEHRSQNPPIDRDVSYTRALQFMQFSRLPCHKELKKRYLYLAQKLHPDRPGGERNHSKN